MERCCALVLINNRRSTALAVQKVLTDWGCNIKTRLGLHGGVQEACSEDGLLFLELKGDKAEHEAHISTLNKIEGVDARLVCLSLENGGGCDCC